MLRIPRSGYPALATWRAGDPDSETSIYRKFDRLSARNYFFLQCQLLEPEAELDKHDEASWHNGIINSRLSLKRWETFSKKKKKAREDQFPEKRVMELQHEIKQKLKEYRTYFTYHGSWQPQMFMIAFNRPLESTSWTFLCFLFCIATEG